MPRLRLEVFSTEHRATAAETVVLDVSALEDAKLGAFEQGYTAGWDDAAAAQSDDLARTQAELGRNLQALGFSYQEARMHILRAIEPLLEEVVTRLLPALARDALAPIVLETLMPLAEKLGDAPVTLLINPASRGAIEQLLGKATGLPILMIEEPTLGEGQVYLRLGTSETKIDLDRATYEITAAVRGFFGHYEKDRKHG